MDNLLMSKFLDDEDISYLMTLQGIRRDLSKINKKINLRKASELFEVLKHAQEENKQGLVELILDGEVVAMHLQDMSE